MDEKVGGATHQLSQMTDFRNALKDCRLLDIHVHRSLLTRCCGNGEEMSMERLGRGMANSEFFMDFPKIIERHNVKDSLDRFPIFLN